MFTMKSKVVGQPSVVSDNFVQIVDPKKKNVKDSISQFQNFCVNFHKFHTRLVLKMLMGAYKM
jgi:hypothetical protein